MSEKIQIFIKPLSYLVFSVLLLSCRKEGPSIETHLKAYTGSVKFEFLPESVEKIFVSQMPWESKALYYFNIIQKDSTWNMWYNASAKNQQSFNGSFCFANSTDGKNWNRPLI